MSVERKTQALWLATWTLIFLAARTDAVPYTLGSGDVVSIKCWQREDLSGEVTVDEDGNVSLPLVGTVKAQGLTPTGLGDELTRRFSFVDRGVSQIGVTVVQYQSRRVHVLGEVGQPGPYGFAQIPGMWEVIRDAGGPTPLSALGRVRVVPRPGAATLVVDLATALKTGNLAGLPALEPGATIVVPRTETIVAEQAVYVMGAVADPGAFSIETAPTLLQAILAAGGPLENANLGSIRVVRPDSLQGRVFEVDLEGYTEEGRLLSNMNLLPGDTVTVSKGRDYSVWNGIWQFASKAGGFVLGTIALLSK